MRYAEINLSGVYLAPIALMVLAAWGILTRLKQCGGVSD